jgi:hypothetical protein
MVSKEQHFFPKILGGKDNFPDYALGSYLCAFKRLTFQEPAKTRMEAIYMIQLGYHM